MSPLGSLLLAILGIANALLLLLVILVVIQAVMSWLFMFNVINPYNPTVRQISQFISAVTEPALRPIRRILPPMSGLDLSPLILILVIEFLIRGWLFGQLARAFSQM